MRTQTDDDPYAVEQEEQRETAVFAQYTEPPLPLVLLFPPQHTESPRDDLPDGVGDFFMVGRTFEGRQGAGGMVLLTPTF